MFKILLYHGSGRVKNAAALTEYDIVLTTYGTVAAEFFDEKKSKKMEQKVKAKRQRILAVKMKMIGWSSTPP